MAHNPDRESFFPKIEKKHGQPMKYWFQVMKDIADWIYENLSGRFYLGDTFITNPETGAAIMQKVAAFERPEEASYFGLFLPNINVHEYTVW